MNSEIVMGGFMTTVVLAVTLVSKARANTKATSRRSSASHRKLAAASRQPPGANAKAASAIVKNTLQNAASAVQKFCYRTQGRFRCAVRAVLTTMHCLRWCIQVTFANPIGRYCVLGTSGMGILFCCLEVYELISIIVGITVIRFALPQVLKRRRAEQDLKTAAKLANLEGDTAAIVISESTKAEDAEFASVVANSKEPTSEMNLGPTSVPNCEPSNDSPAEAITVPIAQPVTTKQCSERASEPSTAGDVVSAEQSVPSSKKRKGAGSVMKRRRAEQDLKTAAKLANLEGDTTAIVMSKLTKAEATTGPIAQPVTNEQGSERASELSTTCDEEVYARQQSLPSSSKNSTSAAGSVRSESSDSESLPAISLAADVYQDTDCDASSKVGGQALAMTAWLRTGHPGQQEWEWTIMQPSSGNAEELTVPTMQTFGTGYRVVMKNGFLDECVAAPTAARRSRSI